MYRGLRIWSAGLLVLLPAVCLRAQDAASGPLAVYVAQPDDSFHWTKRQTGKRGNVSFVELTMTSQTWKGHVWKHQLFIVWPQELRDPSHAVLMIDGAGWKPELDEPPKPEEKLPELAPLLGSLASRLGVPFAIIRQVPYSPMPSGVKEPNSISIPYSFDQFIKTNDPTWPLLVPMVKTVVRAMDTIQAFAKEEWSAEIEHFTLLGASQRGWTTWLTAALDSRVEALAPIVIDILNMTPHAKLQAASFGATAENISAFDEIFIQRITTPDGEKLRQIVDPFNYRNSLKQPKFIVLAANDQNTPLESLNLYWDDLLGEKYVLYIPNNIHNVSDLVRVTGAVSAIHRRAAGKLKLPQLQWHFEENPKSLQLTFTSDVPPAKAVAWTATSQTRDFRNAKWRSTAAELVDGKYRIELARPMQGFAAVFGEGQYTNDLLPYFLSTTVRVVEAAGATPEAPPSE